MPDSFSATVGATVRAELARRRLTQRQLAEVLGVSQTQVGRRLTGEIALNVDELALVATFLGMPVAELVGGGRAASAA